MEKASKKMDVEGDESSTVTSDKCNETSSRDCQHSHRGYIVHPLLNANTLRTNDVQSRFKIVNILSNEPFKRGRWTCSDFKDPLPCEQKSYDIGSGNMSVPSSIYFIPGPDNQLNNSYSAAIVYANGHPVLEPNPLKSQNENIYFSLQAPSQGLTTSNLQSQNEVISCKLISDDDSPVASACICSSDAGTIPNVSNPSQLQTEHEHDKPKLLDIRLSNTTNICGTMLPVNMKTVGHHLADNVSDIDEGNAHLLGETTDAEQVLLNAAPSDDVDDSVASTFAIDNKIEQAMDLVKSHLMFAVHEEVELLKEQIKELTVKNTQLEMENNILRATATPETLAKLKVSRPVTTPQDTTE